MKLSHFKRRRFRGFALLALLIPFSLGTAQEHDLLSALDGRGEFTTLSRSKYEGKGLYGYIDGGAELYHEYGFLRLEVRSVSAEGETLAVEAYEMSDPFAATGILSVSRGGCEADPDLGPLACTSRFQSQFASGRTYFRVVNGKGSEEGRHKLREVALLIRAGAEADPAGRAAVVKPVADLLEILGPGRFGDRKLSPILVRGPLGLQNGLDGWTEIFEGCGKFDLVAASADTAGGDITLGRVTFANPGDQERVLQRWSAPGSNTKRYVAVEPATLVLVEIRGNGFPIDDLEKRIRNAGLKPQGQR